VEFRGAAGDEVRIERIRLDALREGTLMLEMSTPGCAYVLPTVPSGKYRALFFLLPVVEATRPCSVCGGTGREMGPGSAPCVRCNGRGRVTPSRDC